MADNIVPLRPDPNTREGAPIIPLGALQDELAGVTDYNERIWRAARIYAAAGLHVIPIRPGEKSIPPAFTGINYGTVSSKPETMDKWFHPDSGNYRGWGIGLACGKKGGIFVMDLDTFSKATQTEFDPMETFEKLNRNGSLEGLPMQETPSGGVHVFFEWEDGCSNTQSRIADAVDTRGGTASSCKGHVLVFPTEIDGKRYEWMQGGVAGIVPSHIIEKLGSRNLAGKGPGRGNEGVGNDDLEEKIGPEQVQAMLDAIDPDGLTYDEWLRIGQAVNTQYPDERGLEIWDSWSKRGERYKDNECRIRWRGFDPAGSVRSGTLFYFARQGGWLPKEEDVCPNLYMETMMEFNRSHAVVTVGGNFNIYRELPEEGYNRQHSAGYVLSTRTQFRDLYENQKLMIGQGTDAKPVKVPDLWLAWPERRTYANGLGIYPNGDAPVGVLNVYKGLAVRPRKGDCSKILAHITEVWCRGDEELATWVLDWIADLYQDPGDPKGCAIVLRGGEGAGKGIIAGDVIGYSMAPHYQHLIDTEHLTGRFNAHLMQAVFVYADEVVWGGNRKTQGKLKGLVTEQTVTGERKYQDAESQRNCIHLMMASNESWTVPAAWDSRRWCAIDVSNEKTRDSAYFRTLGQEIRSGGREAFAWEMLNRKVTSNLRRAPDTAELQRQRALSNAPHLNEWLAKFLAEGEVETVDENGFGFVANSTLQAHYANWCRDNPKALTAYDPPIGASQLTTKIRQMLGDELVTKKRTKQDRGLLLAPPDRLAAVTAVTLGVEAEDLLPAFEGWRTSFDGLQGGGG